MADTMLRKAQQPCGSRIIHSRIANAIFQMISAKNSQAQPQAAWPLYHPRFANAHIHAFRIANSEEQIKKDGPAATAGPSFKNQMYFYGFWVLVDVLHETDGTPSILTIITNHNRFIIIATRSRTISIEKSHANSIIRVRTCTGPIGAIRHS